MASLKGATSLVEPPRWSDECLETDRARAIAAFREERLKEPVEAYTDQFEIARDAFDELLETTVDFTLLAQNAMEVLAAAKFLEAVRYVASPPISEDDLKTLAETDSLAKKAIKADPEVAQRGGCAPAPHRAGARAQHVDHGRAGVRAPERGGAGRAARAPRDCGGGDCSSECSSAPGSRGRLPAECRCGVQQ